MEVKRFTERYDNGNLKLEIIYSEDGVVKTQTTWFETGRLRYRFYFSGSMRGMLLQWWDTGKLRSVGRYGGRDLKTPTGVFRDWDRDGCVIQKSTFPGC